MVYTHYIQQRDRELKKMAAMRAHNIGFYKPSHWHGWCQVNCFCWWGSSLFRCPFQTEHHHRSQACHHGWCGCWLHSSGSLSGHFGLSLQGWQAGGLGGSGQWENCACPVGTYGHRWSGFLQRIRIEFEFAPALSEEMRLLSKVKCQIKSFKYSSGEHFDYSWLLSPKLSGHTWTDRICPCSVSPFVCRSMLVCVWYDPSSPFDCAPNPLFWVS